MVDLVRTGFEEVGSGVGQAAEGADIDVRGCQAAAEHHEDHRAAGGHHHDVGGRLQRLCHPRRCPREERLRLHKVQERPLRPRCRHATLSSIPVPHVHVLPFWQERLLLQ